MKNVPILFLFLFFTVAQANAGQCSDEIAGLIEPAEPKTKAYFLPKVAHSDLRFAFYFGGGFVIELDREGEDIAPFVKESEHYRDWPYQDDLTFSEQETLFALIPQEKGQHYGIALPGMASIKLLPATGISFMPWENWHLLLTLGERLRIDRDDTDEIYPVGLAFPANPRQSFVYRPLGGEELSYAELLRVERFLRSELNQDFTIISCRRVYVDYPNKKGAAVLLYSEVAPSESQTLLYVVHEQQQGLALARFEMFEGYAVNRGLLFEEDPADFCTGMRDSQLHILPDLNGNGANELLVISTRSFFLSIERDATALDQAQCEPDIIVKKISSVYNSGG